MKGNQVSAAENKNPQKAAKASEKPKYDLIIGENIFHTLKDIVRKSSGSNKHRTAVRIVAIVAICLVLGTMIFLLSSVFFGSNATEINLNEDDESAPLVEAYYNDQVSIVDPLPVRFDNLMIIQDSFDEDDEAADYLILDGGAIASSDETLDDIADGDSLVSSDILLDNITDDASALEFSADGDVNSGDADEPQLPYLIYVSKHSFTIAILGLDEDGEYTKLIRTFPTAVGRTNAQTRAGTYTIAGRRRWKVWIGGVTPYSTRHSGGLWFHGPMFSSRDSNALVRRSYNQIGTNASAGCMRTTTEAAHWIYVNVERGSTVIIANDSRYTSIPITRVSSGQRYDPTDPYFLHDTRLKHVTADIQQRLLDEEYRDNVNVEILFD